VRANALRDEKGSVLMMIAIALPVLLGVTALAIDMGYFFDYKQRMGAAADAAAVAGAFEVKRDPGISDENLRTYVKDDAKRNGFDVDADGTITLTIRHPPTTGLHIGDTKYVEVLISKPMTTFFATVIGRTSVTLNARAVAGPDESSGCVYALNQADTKFPIELDITGNSGTSISVPNCAIVSNGNVTVGSGNTVDAKALDVSASSCTSCTGTITSTTVQSYNVPPSPDPFGDMNQAALFGTSWTCGWTGVSFPTTGGATTAISGTGPAVLATGGTSYTMDPGVYCGDGSIAGIRIGTKVNSPSPPGNCVPSAGDDIITFNPGVYIVWGGGLNWKHSCVIGTGVTFYLTGTVGAHDYPACGGKVLSTDPPDRFILRAPTSGSYEGLLFIQDRTQGVACAAAANPVIADMLPENMLLDGALYFPNHHIKYGATTTSTGNYTILIGGTIEFLNKATLNSNFTGLSSGAPVKRPGLGE
jgi:hypothetical protein